MTAAYLDALPAGLASHRECRAFEAHEGARAHVMDRVEPSRLAAPLATELRETWNGRWIAEVSGVAAQMMLVDELGETAYLEWIYKDALRLYERGFLRHLMRVLSPSLVILGGAHRWAKLHAGSALNVSKVTTGPRRVGGSIELRYPEALFPAPFCRALGETFRAALEMAHAKAVTVKLLEHDRQRARFEFSWAR